MRHLERTESELVLAEIELRLAAREYADCHTDPLGIDSVRAKESAAKLREAAERYAAMKHAGFEWKLIS
jgi:hypothetical protein